MSENTTTGTNGKAKIIRSIIGNAVFWTAAVAAVVLAIASVVLGRNRSTPPFVAGRAVLWVETGSMEPEIPAESFILVKKSDGTDVKPGDVITFLCTDESSRAYGLLVTHRVTEVTDAGYKTKGDNSLAADGRTVKPADVVAIYRRNLPVLTFFGKLFKSPLGITAILLIFAISSAALYVPDIVNAIRGDEEERKKKEFDRRVTEEAERLAREAESDSNGKDKTSMEPEENQRILPANDENNEKIDYTEQPGQNPTKSNEDAKDAQ